MGENPFKNGIDLEENDNNNYEENTGNELIDFFEGPEELLDLKIVINKNFKELNPIFKILIAKLNRMEEIYKGIDRFKGKVSEVKKIATNIGKIQKEIENNQNDFTKFA